MIDDMMLYYSAKFQNDDKLQDIIKFLDNHKIPYILKFSEYSEQYHLFLFPNHFDFVDNWYS